MTTSDELLALIDRLEDLLERSDLAELEVQAGDLGILLRKPGQLLPGVVDQAAGGGASPVPAAGAQRAGGAGESGAPTIPSARADPGRREAGATDHESQSAATRTHLVLAPLTGVFYGSPSPEAAPYVRVGSEVVSGQVIGLIEAMKLFNEIKSDASGRIVRIHATHGTLVRAKQPLVEIEPS